MLEKWSRRRGFGFSGAPRSAIINCRLCRKQIGGVAFLAAKRFALAKRLPPSIPVAGSVIKKSIPPNRAVWIFGRGDGDRTHDLSVPNAARYQLRYASNSLVYYSR